MYNVLLVEDAPDYQKMVAEVLGSEFSIIVAPTVERAKSLCKNSKFDLMIVDVLLPDGNGIEFCAEMRDSDCPIVMLTGQADSHDKILGWNTGVDDYITKPFVPAEFKSRILSRVQKFRGRKDSGEVLKWDDLEINASFHEAHVLDNGQRVKLDLTPHEFKILHQLVRNHERSMSRPELIQTVWGEGMHVTERTVDKHVSSLRQKLGDRRELIQTVSGLGYRILSLSKLKKSS
jgi:DNA-binding response OmpR family regulator